MRIYYLSGRISDSSPEQQALNILKFYEVERDLVARGFNVFNPAKLEVVGGKWEYYLARDLKFIIENKPFIYLIDEHWHTSLGARLEVEVARLYGLTIISPM